MKLVFLLLFLVFPAFSSDILAVLKEKLGSMQHKLSLKHSIIDNLNSNINGNTFLNVNVKNNYNYYGEKNYLSRFKEKVAGNDDEAQLSHHTNEAMILGERIQELETEVHNLERELQDAVNGNQSNLMSELDLEKANGIKLQSESAQKSKDMEKMKSEKDILEQKLEENAQTTLLKEQKLAQTIQQLDDELKESHTLQQRIQGLEKGWTAANNRLQRAEAENQNTESRLHELEKQYESDVKISNFEKTRLKSELLEKQIDLECAYKYVENQRDYLQVCEKQIRQMHEKLEENAQTTGLLKDQIKNLIVDNHNLTVDNKKKDEIIQRVQHSNCELKEQINQMDRELKSLVVISRENIWNVKFLFCLLKTKILGKKQALCRWTQGVSKIRAMKYVTNISRKQALGVLVFSGLFLAYRYYSQPSDPFPPVSLPQSRFWDTSMWNPIRTCIGDRPILEQSRVGDASMWNLSNLFRSKYYDDAPIPEHESMWNKFKLSKPTPTFFENLLAMFAHPVRVATAVFILLRNLLAKFAHNYSVATVVVLLFEGLLAIFAHTNPFTTLFMTPHVLFGLLLTSLWRMILRFKPNGLPYLVPPRITLRHAYSLQFHILLGYLWKIMSQPHDLQLWRGLLQLDGDDAFAVALFYFFIVVTISGIAGF